MIGKKKFEEILSYILSKSKADETQVSLHTEHSYLTRFANSIVHQNVMEKNAILSIKTAVGKKNGEVETNNFSKSNILNILNRSIEIARHSAELPDFFGFPSPQKYKTINTYFENTLRFSQKEKISILKDIFDSSRPFSCYGAISTGAAEIAIGNSNGLSAYSYGTDAEVRLTIKGKSGAAFGQSANRDIRKINFSQLRDEVLAKAKFSQSPKNIKPGKYTVFLTPEAFSEMLNFLAFLGFNSLLYQEGRSCLINKVGKRVFSNQFTLYDDPLNSNGFAFPFDSEGIPKQRLTLVKNGTVKNLVYDRFTAHKAGKKTTGHFIGRSIGPIPLHLRVKKGEKSFRKILGNIKSGIFITTFHYINVVEPRKLILTGMTRNGTFLIKNGKIAFPLKNLRFNQGFTESLGNIISISKEVKLVGNENSYGPRFPMGTIAPFIAIKDFNFTGATEF